VRAAFNIVGSPSFAGCTL